MCMSSLGMAAAYNSRDKRIHKYCRHVLALLPVHEIPEALSGLSVKVTTAEMTHLQEYVTKTWVESTLCMPPVSWNCNVRV